MKTFTISLILCATVISSCVFQQQTCTNKNIVKKELNVETFDGIGLGVSADVKLTQGEPQKIVLEGQDCDLEKIETEIKGSTLEIGTKSGTWSVGKVTIYITVKDINKLDIGGSGSIVSKSPINTTDLSLDVAGSGDIIINDLTAKTIFSSIAGSGSIQISGNATVEKHKIDIAGSGDVLAKDLPTQTVKVDIAGSGTCKVNVTEKLKADIAGSGDVFYRGKPVVETDIAGSGTVKQLE